MGCRLGKLASKSVDSRYVRFSIGKEACLERRAYLCVSVIYALFSLYCLCTGCFQASSKGLLTWVRKDKQIYIHTYMHTDTHTHIHTHTLFVKQFQETWARAWLTKKATHFREVPLYISYSQSYRKDQCKCAMTE